LVTVPSEAAHQCLLGDLPSCTSVLDLNESGESFMHWYASPGERRAVLQGSFAEYFDRPASATTWRDCMSGDDPNCIQLLRSLPRGVIPRPLDTEAHRLLAYVAVRLGGREAYPRLLADSGAALSRRLEVAAGVQLDTLLGLWRREVIAARPTPVTLPPWGAPAALGWILLLAGCGLTSSRWRVT
ncbi:MAG TPA: hypothetical protein VGU74_14995, partial [Gemmatimonadales bacterium]|nr:hypothetical protein [Gemmatimonadales bacterium]